MHRLTLLPLTPPSYVAFFHLVNTHLGFLQVFSWCVCVYMCEFVYLTHIVVVPLMKTLCFQEKKKKEKKNLLVFPHDCGTIIASRSPSPVPGKIAGLAGICIIVFRAIVGGFGLLTQSYRLATCPEQMNSAFVQHYYLFLQCYFWAMNNLIKYYKTI